MSHRGASAVLLPRLLPLLGLAALAAAQDFGLNFKSGGGGGGADQSLASGLQAGSGSGGQLSLAGGGGGGLPPPPFALGGGQQGQRGSFSSNSEQRGGLPYPGGLGLSGPSSAGGGEGQRGQTGFTSSFGQQGGPLGGLGGLGLSGQSTAGGSEGQRGQTGFTSSFGQQGGSSRREGPAGGPFFGGGLRPPHRGPSVVSGVESLGSDMAAGVQSLGTSLTSGLEALGSSLTSGLGQRGGSVNGGFPLQPASHSSFSSGQRGPGSAPGLGLPGQPASQSSLAYGQHGPGLASGLGLGQPASQSSFSFGQHGPGFTPGQPGQLGQTPGGAGGSSITSPDGLTSKITSGSASSQPGGPPSGHNVPGVWPSVIPKYGEQQQEKGALSGIGGQHDGLDWTHIGQQPGGQQGGQQQGLPWQHGQQQQGLPWQHGQQQQQGLPTTPALPYGDKQSPGLWAQQGDKEYGSTSHSTWGADKGGQPWESAHSTGGLPFRPVGLENILRHVAPQLDLGKHANPLQILTSAFPHLDPQGLQKGLSGILQAHPAVSPGAMYQPIDFFSKLLGPSSEISPFKFFDKINSLFNPQGGLSSMFPKVDLSKILGEIGDMWKQGLALPAEIISKILPNFGAGQTNNLLEKISKQIDGFDKNLPIRPSNFLHMIEPFVRSMAKPMQPNLMLPQEFISRFMPFLNPEAGTQFLRHISKQFQGFDQSVPINPARFLKFLEPFLSGLRGSQSVQRSGQQGGLGLGIGGFGGGVGLGGGRIGGLDGLLGGIGGGIGGGVGRLGALLGEHGSESSGRQGGHHGGLGGSTSSGSFQGGVGEGQGGSEGLGGQGGLGGRGSSSFLQGSLGGGQPGQGGAGGLGGEGGLGGRGSGSFLQGSLGGSQAGQNEWNGEGGSSFQPGGQAGTSSRAQGDLGRFGFQTGRGAQGQSGS